MSKYLIITGGSRGIGEKTIAYFQEQGWHTINLSRSPCLLTNVVNIPVDLTDWDKLNEYQSQLSTLIKNPSTISLVHNAAHYERDKVDTLNPQTLKLTLDINVIAAAALNTLLLPIMTQSSSIIYIGSTLGEKAVPNSASYSISKHALIGLMRATCQDLAGKNIHTCCICPGFVDTHLLRDTMEASRLEQLIANKVTAKRLIQPIEIAKTVYFCATNAVINGAVLHSNLGQVAD